MIKRDYIIFIKSIKLLLEFFEGNEEKVEAWLTLENLNFGGISPDYLFRMGRGYKVLKFIESAKDEGSWNSQGLKVESWNISSLGAQGSPDQGGHKPE